MRLSAWQMKSEQDGACCSYVYLLMGVLIGSAVVPIACCLSWSKCTATAAISGAWGGLAASITCWLVYTKCVYGEISLETTGKVNPWRNRAGRLSSMYAPRRLLPTKHSGELVCQ